MANLDLRKEIKAAGVFHYQVAQAYGVSECTFVRKLRNELPDAEKARIREIIAELAKEGQA